MASVLQWQETYSVPRTLFLVLYRTLFYASTASHAKCARPKKLQVLYSNSFGYNASGSWTASTSKHPNRVEITCS